MGKWFLILLLIGASAPSSFAGDEDVKKAETKKEMAEPVPAPLPPEPEAPPPALGEEETVGPEFKEPPEVEVPAPAAPVKKARVRKDPDLNLDYSELLSFVTPLELGEGVLPPSLGTRGYRPNLLAATYGEKTAGYGLTAEYSFNRLAMGAYYSYRPLTDYDRKAESQSFVGGYLLYRWLPFDFSPYFSGGLEIGTATRESFGGTAGVGMEARIYSGWTLLLGWSYHSTVRKGFFGGGLGWGF